jgi:integrase
VALMAKRLTQLSIDHIKPGKTRMEIPDAGVPGLYLVVQPSGRKSWAVRYRRKGDRKSRKLTFDYMSLALVHKLAREAIDKVALGGDPASKDGAGSKLFGDVFDQYMLRHVTPNCKSHREIRRVITKDALPLWRGKDIRTITKSDVLDALDRVSDRGGISANRLLAHLKGMFNWAVDRSIIDASPVTGIKKPATETARDRILNDDEVRRVLSAAGEIAYPHGSVVQLLLLTGQRLGEVSGMKWSEVDLDKKEWNLPAERCKNGKPHTVPLSDAAVAIIKSAPHIDAHVFSATPGKSISSFDRSKRHLDKLTGISGWVLHDLRRTVASGMQRLGVSLPVIEKVLNHTSGSFRGIVAVYQRHDFADEKRKALEAWASFILAEPDDVVVLRA